jgi:hypothetical protein
LHDSTGSIPEVSTYGIPFDAVDTVTRFALRAVGSVPVVAAGNCCGGLFALAQAARTEACLGAVCILPETLEPGPLNSAMRKAAGRRVRALFRSNRALRRMVGPLRVLDLRTRRALRESLPGALARAPVLFLYDREHLRTGINDFGRIENLLRRLPPRHRARSELRVVATRGLDRFGSVENQELTVQALVEWAEACSVAAPVVVG